MGIKQDENDFKYKQHTDIKNFEKNQQKKSEDEIRFKQSSMDIYICGKYEPFMKLLIGNYKNNNSESKKNPNYTNLTINQKEDKDSNIIINLEQNEIKIEPDKNDKEDSKDSNPTENFMNSLNEGLINNDKYQINNDSKNVKGNIDIEEILKYFPENENLKKITNFTVENTDFNWKLHFYCNKESNYESLKLIRDNINSCIDYTIKNTLLISIELDKQIYEVIDIFNEINKEFHPLFLFIIKNSCETKDKAIIKENIQNYILKKNINNFNIRNIKILNEIDLNDSNENYEIIKEKKYLYILEIYLFFINSWFYYNNFGDDYVFKDFINHKILKELLRDINEKNLNLRENKNKSLGLFNILMLGRPGVGKSTLLNLLSNCKRSMEGRGISVTKYITRYLIQQYNISIYDSPGFELDKDIKKIKKLIENLNKHLIKAKNQIHLAFYLINALGGRDFYDTEKEIINILYKNKIRIFFLLTFSSSLEQGNNFKEIIEIDLLRLFKEIDNKKGIKYYNEYVKIFPVHLLDDKSTKNFGLRTVLEEAYNSFKHCIMEENDKKKIKEILSINLVRSQSKQFNEKENKKIRNQEIIKILNQNENILYKYIKDINDIVDTAKTDSELIVNRYSYISAFLGLLGIVTSPLIEQFKKNIILKVAENYKKVINEDEKNILVQENSNNIENSYENKIPLISSYNNYMNIKTFGEFYIKEFSKELKNEGIEGLSNYIMELIENYNKSINGLKEIGQRFNI